MSEHSHHHPHGVPEKKGPPLKLIIVVILMLAAMGIYVLTMNESFRPGGTPTATAPAR